jgi:hypothetical protein
MSECKMNLFGLKLPSFSVQFRKIFCIEYEHGLIRIRDKETSSCIVNCKVPVLIGTSEQDMLLSLYICIFKYECEYESKYSKKLYRNVRKYIDSFIKDVYIRRCNLKIASSVQDCLLDAAHGHFYKLEYPELSNKVNQLCKTLALLDDLNTFAINGCHQSIIYSV